MEALVPALVEVVALAVPLLVALVEALVLAMMAALELAALGVELAIHGSITAALAARQVARSKRSTDASAESPVSVKTWLTSPAVARKLRIAAIVVGALLAVTTVALLALNFLFFQATVRWVLGRVEAKTGIAVEFAKADGNLFTGKIRLADASAKRSGDDVSDFEVTIDELAVDLAMPSILGREFEYERVEIRGVRGSYKRLGAAPPKQRRDFVIRSLKIEDVQLKVEDKSRPGRLVALQLGLDSLAADQFRSRWAAFDVLFKCNAKGSLGGKAFQISNTRRGDQESTVWRGQDLPVFIAGVYLGGPFAWLTDGRLDLETTTEWSLSQQDPKLQMHWQMVIRDLKAEAPAEFPFFKRGVVEPAVRFLNDNPARLPLAFDVTLDRNGFQGELSPLAEGLFDFVGAAAVKQLALQAGVPEQQVRDEAKAAFNKLRGFLRGRDGKAEAGAKQ